MATAQLPRSCFFGTNGGPPCNTLWNDCDAAGFENVTGPNSQDKATQLWITPPAGRKTQISPPGTNNGQSYDINSLIELVAAAQAPTH